MEVDDELLIPLLELLHQIGVDRQIAEIVDDDRHAQIAAIAQEAPQQRGLAGPQEAADDCDGERACTRRAAGKRWRRHYGRRVPRATTSLDDL